VLRSPFSRGTVFSTGASHVVFEEPYYTNPNDGPTYDVFPDGRRFLIVKDQTAASQSTAPSQFVAVLNWSEKLKRRVPSSKQ
jgi:hypothetical protein